MQSTVTDSFSTTTLLGSYMGLTAMTPVTQNLNKAWTLNTHLNIFPDEDLTESPKIRYYGVGIQGAYNVDDGILSAAYNPQRTNMNLFHLIPLRCRPIDEDLDEATRAQYRLRRRVSIQGSEYFLYFLKALSFDSEVKFKTINIDDGREEPYELNPENLEPTPEKPVTDTTLDSSLSSVVAYITADVHVEAEEVLEYIRLNYSGDTRYAKISELGFFTGMDKQVSGTTGLQNIPINYTEAVGVMLYNHMTWIGTPLTREGSTLEGKYEITSQGAITIK